jgi:hypothetical protein
VSLWHGVSMQWPSEQISPSLQAALLVHGGMHVLSPYGQLQGGDGPQTMVPPSAWHALSEVHVVICMQIPQGGAPSGTTQVPYRSQSLSERHRFAPRERRLPASFVAEVPPAPPLPVSPVVCVPPVAKASWPLPAGPASAGVTLPKPFLPQAPTRNSPTSHVRVAAIGPKHSATRT